MTIGNNRTWLNRGLAGLCLLAAGGVLAGLTVGDASAGLSTLAFGAAAVVLALVAWVLVAVGAGGRRAAPVSDAGTLRDALTGLPNRTGFEQRAAAELSRARRRGERFTFLYLGFDDFARVKEELGAAVGDQVLRTVALETLAVLRGEDVMARYDSHDFVLLLPGISAEEAHRVVARVAAAVERAVPGTGPLAKVTASAGTACYPVDGETVIDLVEAARGGADGVMRRRAEAAHRLSAELVPEDSVADCTAPGDEAPCAESGTGWRPRRPAIAGAAMAFAATGAWFAGPAVLPTVGLRASAAGVALLAAVGCSLLAARHTSRRERYGWLLVAGGLTLWFLPLAGPVAGLMSAAGLLLLVDDRWLGDRYRMLDVAGVCLAVSAVTVALVLPGLLEADGLSTLTAATRISAAILGAALISSTALVIYWTPARWRPDVMLIAAGYAIAVGSVANWTLALRENVFVPSMWWELGVVLAAVLVASGALLRLSHASTLLRGGGLEVRTFNGTVVGDILLAAMIGVIYLAGGSVTFAAMVPLLLCILALRDLRSRFLERDRRQLRTAVLRGKRELALQWQANLAALGNALEARDGYTGEHSAATTWLAGGVARELGLSRAARDEVEAVALLHDIGKIGMPDEILRKPAQLTDDEWHLMREHPVIGERILHAVPGLEQIARSVRHEHERWDGTGYPDCLEGQDIPLASRIVLACDAWEAMVTDRPYRKARSRGEALAELHSSAGSQLDPAVVHALLDVLGGQDAPLARPARSRWLKADHRRKAGSAG